MVVTQNGGGPSPHSECSVHDKMQLASAQVGVAVTPLGAAGQSPVVVQPTLHS